MLNSLVSSPPWRPIASILLALLLGGVAWLMTQSGEKAPVPPGAIALDSSAVSESSGLARSRRREDWLWTHNDSGDSARLFAFTETGHLQALLAVEKASAVDWEDMCTFVREGVPYMTIADVGDNAHLRTFVTLYVLTEPEIPTGPPVPGQLPSALKRPVEIEIRVRYPKGAVNCEAVAYDPWREQFILVTKETLQAQLYAVDIDWSQVRQETTAKWMGSIILPMVTGASISDDGQVLALATYGPTCLLKRMPTVDWSAASSDQRRRATWQTQVDGDLKLVDAPPRPQGESICIDRAGSGVWMTSEGNPMLLFHSAIQ